MRYLCKFGELILKSRLVRRQFAKHLRSNVKDAFKDIDPNLRISHGQGFLEIECAHSNAMDRLKRIFGIISIASVDQLKFHQLKDIEQQAEIRFKDRIAGKSFAVRCKRQGKHEFTSRDVERIIGAKLTQYGHVNLSNPDVTCRLDIREDIVQFYNREEKGAGGLPVGCQGRAICLISGGIDSPVAAWMALKRGLRVDYLFCNLGGSLQEWGPKATAKHLADSWSYGYLPKFYSLDFTPLLNEFRRHDHKYRNILLKRYFYRAASHLTRSQRSEVFVTGEALGQVSTQTVSNLQTISSATDCFVFQPIIGLDKSEIMDIAKHIGTFEISKHVPEFCNVAVRKPRTQSRHEELEFFESQIDNTILETSLMNMKKFDLKSLSTIDKPEEFSLKEIPANARFVWISSGESKEKIPENANDVISSVDIREFFKKLKWDGPIVIGCHRGMLSRDTSIYLREKGFESYSLI